MYARLSSVLFPIAAILFVGAILWGYQEHQEKNSILIKAENQYQRAFHDLNHHMNRLQDELGQTLAVSSASHGMQRKGLVNVWRLTSQAQNEINQLPLAMLPFNKAESFLSKISNFAYRTSVRDLTKQPLSPGEMNTLKSLYAKSGDINKELGRIQDAVIKDHLRWMDVEAAMASENNPHDNTIIDGFRTVDKKIGEYPETDWGPSAMAAPRLLSTDGVPGKEMTPAEIRARAASFIGNRAAGAGQMTVTESGGRTKFRTYTVTSQDGGGTRIQMDYTRKGGHLLWFMNPREVKARRINFDTARNHATNFLVRNGYRGMTPVTYDEYDHVAVFSFAGTQNGVRIYPDKVTVRVALDNGEVVGMQATQHVFATTKQLLATGKPKVSREQAAKGLNPEFRVKDYSLAIVENEMRQPVLCHEFIGNINGSDYRIYMNAETGIEETVERIPDASKPIYGT
ncbi:germination protein YpeB [Cohnella sp. CFH 77786]|uniref:germination protein YpeB n=1 Tax=Cohnella sp. CFH 77786 TaxID=2662265 RepID=UPI001C60BDC1|nr:germination protein YpeB [Cohnella sp. CFH 77786]MBW5446668.1 germination protein YpeB [Cohnella sp. CFH 77786]